MRKVSIQSWRLERSDSSKAATTITNHPPRARIARALPPNSLEFDEIFGPLFHDSLPHFKLFRGRVFQVFAASYIFSQEEFRGLDSKIDALFELFDFDGNKRLNRVEMEMLFECVTEAIHSVTATNHPNPGCETILTRRCFRDLSPKDGDVHLPDFTSWLAKQDDIMQYLHQYINARFVTGLQDELKLAVTNANHSFNIMANSETNTITKKQFLEILKDCHYPPKESEFEGVIKCITQNGGLHEDDEDKISENAFRAIVVPWLSLSILDVDKNGTIDLGEVRRGEGSELPNAFYV